MLGRNTYRRTQPSLGANARSRPPWSKWIVGLSVALCIAVLLLGIWERQRLIHQIRSLSTMFQAEAVTNGQLSAQLERANQSAADAEAASQHDRRMFDAEAAKNAEVQKLQRLAEQRAADAETARQSERYRFLISSAKEWQLDDATCRSRLMAAKQVAAEQNWDQEEVNKLLSAVRTESELPDEAKAELVWVDRSAPAITVALRLTNKQDEPILGLGRQDFSLRRNDRQLRHFDVSPIFAFQTDHSIAILVDCSGSMQGRRLQLAQAAIRELRSVNGLNTRFTLITFAAEATRRSPLTTDWQLIESQIDRLTAEGGTALYRALSAAMNDLLPCGGARSMVVVTDGQDTAGGLSLDEVISGCRTNKIAVHVVGFASSELDQVALRKLADDTYGGFHLASEPQSCAQALRDISWHIAKPAYRLVFLDTANINEPFDIAIGGIRGPSLHIGSP